MRWVLIGLLAALWSTCSTCLADPREAETSDFVDEFGVELDEKTAPSSSAPLETISLDLEHNLSPTNGNGDFSPRGKVSLQLVASAATGGAPHATRSKVLFAEMPALQDAQVAQLQQKLSHNQLYTIRVKSDPANAVSPYIVTSIPLCLLVGTRFREDLAFHVNDQGKLLAIEYRTPYSSQDMCEANQKFKLKDVRFTSFGTIVKEQAGPSPPAQITPKHKIVPAGVKPAEADQEKKPEESQSFFRRYWYIILPIVLMSLFGSEPAPQGGAGGAGGAAAGGGAARRK